MASAVNGAAAPTPLPSETFPYQARKKGTVNLYRLLPYDLHSRDYSTAVVCCRSIAEAISQFH